MYRQVQRLVQQGPALKRRTQRPGRVPGYDDQHVPRGRGQRPDGAGGRQACHPLPEGTPYEQPSEKRHPVPQDPCLCVLAAVLIIFLAVMPKIEPFFEGMPLPAFTAALMAFSHFLMNRWYVLIIAILCAVALVQILLSVPAVRFFWTGSRCAPPLWASSCASSIPRALRTQSSLYSSGLSMIRSLEIAAATLGNQYVTAQFADVIKQVRAGDMLSKAIQQVDGFDAKARPTIYVGEETGQLDQMLENIAENYEYESDAALTRLTGMIEPLMIVVMAIVICLIMVGVLVPHLEYVR